MEMPIHTGVYGVGGACEDCQQLLADPIVVLGKSRFMNFTKSPSGGVSAGISDQANVYINFIDGKNITIDGNKTLMGFNITLPNAQTLKAYQNDPALNQYKDLLKSVSY